MKNYLLVISNGKARKELRFKAGTTRAKAEEVAEQMWRESFSDMIVYLIEDGQEILAFEV